MTTAEVLGVFAAIVGAGGFATIAATVTKYLIDRRKMQGDYDTDLLAKMQQRIDELEERDRECMDRCTKMAQRIGYLEAIVEASGYKISNNPEHKKDA